MRNPVYTAEARVEGGRERGRGRTPRGEIDVALRLPGELGGDGDGANPEQLFAIGYAACFEAAMQVAAQRLKIPVERVADVAIDARVMLLAGEDRRFVLGAELDVSLPSIDDPAIALEVARATHGICPYSNATRGNIDVAIRVNGVTLEHDDDPVAA
jgi:lipoyl-dependent peroxiredoxin